ncbi:MAG: PaaI family thioesterase [Planctomycetota bacterium]|nr:MAG: PaaI family thioesterase [Planctomycetota bacterium]
MSDAVLTEAQKSAVFARLRSIPIYATLKFDVLGAEPGKVSMRVPRDPRYDGIFESFHGGILMTAADSAAAFAVLTVAGADAKITTTDMSIRFLAKCLTDVRVEARVIKAGRTMVPVHVDIYDANEVLVAIAQVAYIRLG